MTFRTSTWLLSLATLVSTNFLVPVLAAEQDAVQSTYSRQDNRHFYLGARVGSNYLKDACNEGVLDCDSTSLGYGLYGGYQFNPWFSLEGGLTDNGDFSSSNRGNNASVDIKGAEVSAMFTYGLSKNWSVYTRLGAAYQNIDKESSTYGEQSSNGWNGLVAVGVDYALSTRWSVRAEYQLIDGIGDSNISKADMYFTSLGLTYHFGQNKIQTVKAATQPVTREKCISRFAGVVCF
ncbi:porin [Psychromonas sp. CD1]|uniref:porin n=1 Tax=Psychromonas sp. CD1 TaxID=1979839 RepID=UPI000B9B9D6B|nr:porin [Psychromonas sp. CD1]